MARKTKTVVIETGRDAGRHYFIKEMPATQAEKWGMRALLALMHGGIEIPDGVAKLGLYGLVTIGIEMLGKLPWDLAEPLLDEMFGCISFIPDPTKIDVATGNPVTRPLIEDDIEDAKTRLLLRRAVMELHFDFFTDGALLNMAQELAATRLTTTSKPRTSRRKSPR